MNQRDSAGAARVLLIVTVLSTFATSLAYEVSTGPAGWQVSLLTAAASTTAGAVVLLGMLRWWFPRRMNTPKSVLIYVAWFTLLIAARAVTAFTVNSAVGDETSAMSLYRFVAGWTILCPWLLWVTSAVTRFHTLRAGAASLREETAQLQARRQLLPDEIASQRALLTDTADREIIAAVDDSSTALVELLAESELTRNVAADDMAAVGLRIQRHAEGAVRTLSHQFANGSWPPDAPAGMHHLGEGAAAEAEQSADITSTPPPEPHRARVHWNRFRNIDSPFSPIPLAIGSAYLSFPFFLWMASQHGSRAGGSFVFAAIVLVLSTAIHAVAVRSGRRVWPRAGAAVAGATVALAVIGLAAAATTALYLGITEPKALTGILIAGGACAVGMGWLCATLAAIRYDADALLRSEMAANSLERLIEHRLHNELRAIRSDLARLLHTTVQGRFIVAATLVADGSAIGSDADADVYARRVERISEALSVLQSVSADMAAFKAGPPVTPETAETIESMVTRVLAPWQGLIGTNVELASDVRLWGPDAEAVSWLAEEMTLNAVRHGDANKIAIAIHWHAGDADDADRAEDADDADPRPPRADPDDRVLTLRATDNGAGVSRTPKPGLGFEAVHQAGGSVKIWENDSGTSVQVNWPISDPPLPD